MITSCISAIIAPMPYINSNLKPMYTSILSSATNIAHSPLSLNSSPICEPTNSSLIILNGFSLEKLLIKKLFIDSLLKLLSSLSLIRTSLLLPNDCMTASLISLASKVFLISLIDILLSNFSCTIYPLEKSIPQLRP